MLFFVFHFNAVGTLLVLAIKADFNELVYN